MSGTTDIFPAAAEVEAFCRGLGWKYCFIGGIAVQRWGTPRQRRWKAATYLVAFACCLSACSVKKAGSRRDGARATFNLLSRLSPPARTFRLDQFDLGPRLSIRQLYRVVGPPNRVVGSGLLYLVYDLGPGRWLWLNYRLPHGRTLATALLVNEKGTRRQFKRIYEASGR